MNMKMPKPSSLARAALPPRLKNSLAKLSQKASGLAHKAEKQRVSKKLRGILGTAPKSSRSSSTPVTPQNVTPFSTNQPAFPQGTYTPASPEPTEQPNQPEEQDQDETT